MVVRFQLTVKHIRGHSFPIETDIEGDVLGLKVQIWETQKIPIENQRLVFGGKELQDNTKLSSIGIGENSTIFLVESVSDLPPQAQSEIPIQVTVASDAQVIPQQSTTVSNAVMVTTINSNSRSYEPLSQEEGMISEERITSVMDLAFWVRLYCMLGMLISAVSIFGCWYSVIPLLIYIFGFCGTRKLNRCLLVFPLIITAFIGFGLTILSVYWLINFYNGWEFMYLFVGFLHVAIFSCICKLMCRISKLSCEEWQHARIRIRSRGCCC